MRVIRLLIALCFVALGAVVGALNRQVATVDFAAAQISTTLGVALLVALLLGVILGGLAIAASVVLPLRRRVVRLERQQTLPDSPAGT